MQVKDKKIVTFLKLSAKFILCFTAKRVNNFYISDGKSLKLNTVKSTMNSVKRTMSDYLIKVINTLIYNITHSTKHLL